MNHVLQVRRRRALKAGLALLAAGPLAAIPSAARGGVVGLWALGLSKPGLGWSVDARNTRGYGHARAVVQHLQEMKLPDSVIERVAHANYARVLKQALK